LEQRFSQAMDNDFNTAQALGHLFDSAKTINKIIRNLAGNQHPADLALLDQSAEIIGKLAAVTGILKENPIEFLDRQKEEILAGIDIDRQTIEQLIALRNEARANKDWGLSDQIRDKLLAQSIEIMDGPAGTSWDVKRE